MSLYRRKLVIVPLLIIAIFLAWLSYLWAVDSYRPSIRQTQALTEVADQVHAIMQQENLDFVQINDGWSSALEGEMLEKISSDIEKANNKIEHAAFSYLCRPKCYFTAYFYIDMPPKGVIDGPYRYLQYNPDGHLKEIVSPEYRQNRLTEHMQYNRFGWSEEFVPSISEALKEDSGYVYFFCEPLEQERWHFCRGQFG
ncbi:hypothetical protein [Vreelandella titanicae]|uniref:hypothetical protein n=1 Tax=Vreelandella titanicae TaxID=664683 RepID=UPI0039BFC8B4